ncbi:MAG: DUF4389 domain-containing protein [Polyangiaceae bacterium]|nr:DUF4389 domain-containing protein [Polyangiaceae bacterium]
MHFDITHQSSYSRAELLLRTFFGWLYIMAPHAFVLMFLAIWSSIVSFIAWWAILFTGRYPQSFFEFNAKMLGWNMRLSASLSNLIDGYPAIGLSASHPAVQVNVPYPQSLSRGLLLLRTFFGFLYVGIPHLICLYGRLIATAFLQFLAWWAVLFTGKYPESWFKFNVGTLRWSLRVNLYMANMTDVYPPFSGLPTPS